LIFCILVLTATSLRNNFLFQVLEKLFHLKIKILNVDEIT